MRPLLTLLFIFIAFSSFGQQGWLDIRPTPGGNASRRQLLATDIPSNFLRSNTTNVFTGNTSFDLNGFTWDVGDVSDGLNGTWYADAFMINGYNSGSQFKIYQGSDISDGFISFKGNNYRNGFVVGLQSEAVTGSLERGIGIYTDNAGSGDMTERMFFGEDGRFRLLSGEGNDGDVLTYNGFEASWQAPSSGSDQGPFTSFLSPLPQSYNYSGAPSFRNMNNSDLPIRNSYKVKLTGIPVVFGDSFTNDVGASPGTYGWLQQFRAANNIVVNNQAVSSRGIYSASIASYAALPTFNNGNTVIMMVGHNDLGQGGGTTANYNKIVNGHRAIIVNAWLKFGVAASAITNTGTWSNYTAQTLKAVNLGGNARQSSTATNTLSYTTTEASDNIVIGTIGTDGSTYDYGTFEVTIDGVSMGTYNPNGQTNGVSDGANDNGRTPNVLVYSGLRNSTHAITITVNQSKTTVIDYVGYMLPIDLRAGVIVLSIPRRTAAGYATGSATDANVTAANTAIENDINTTFPNGPITFIYQERNYNPATDVGGDDIHPNNTGHTHIFQNAQSAVDANVSVFSDVNFIPKTTTGPTLRMSAMGNGFTIAHNTDAGATTVFDATRGTTLFQSVSSPTATLNGFNWYVGSVNTTPALRLNLNNTGQLIFSNSPNGSTINFLNTSIAPTTSSGIEILSGATNLAGTYTATSTFFNSYLAAMSASGHIWRSNSGLTIGNTFAPSELMRLTQAGNLLIGSTTANAKAYIVQSALTGANIIPSLRIDGGAHTSATTATEFTDINFNLARSVVWAAGTVANQRFIRVQSPTTGTATHTRSVTMSIGGAPSAGSGSATTAIGLEVETRALANTTTGYGAFFNAPSGAGTNYAAGFSGDVVFSTLSGTGTRQVVASSAGVVSTATLYLDGSATLDFVSTNAQESSTLTITVTGAADGDPVSLGVPDASNNANSNFTAYVSAPNTVTVKFNNYSIGAINPASGTFKVRVHK